MSNDVRQFSSDKILKHIDRISDWLQGNNPSPITVEIDLTNVCNHRCPECVVSYFRVNDNNILNQDLAKDIIRQLSEAKIRGLIFTGGGDPLCHPHAKEIVSYAYEQGVDIGFITNCSLVDVEIAEVLLRSCVWVRVSMDAASPEVFKKVHGKGEKEFKRVLKNIRLLTELKKKTQSKCTIGIGYLTCDDSVGEMEDAAKLAKELGVDYIQYRPMQIHRGGHFDYHWTNVEEQMTKCFKYNGGAYKVLYSKHKYDMMKRKDYGRNYKKCYGHQFATVVAADAKMYICCHTRAYDNYCIGDFRKNSFQEIWNSKERQEAANRIDFKECIPLCRDNTFNQVLWDLTQEREHKNFL